MLSSPNAQAAFIETVENQIFALHLRRQVLLQIETQIGYLVATDKNEKVEAPELAQAISGLRAHRREHRLKTPSKASHICSTSGGSGAR